jgi:outer membrane protein OmpA-like peptidoglycan-associated protein
VTIYGDDGNDVLTGGAGTDRFEAQRSGALVLTDASFTAGAEVVGLASIEQAALGGASLDTTLFTGASAFIAGAPQWTPEGPGPVTGGHVAGMTAQGKPVAGAINGIVTNDDGTIFVGSVNGGVWRNGNRTVLFEFDSAALTPEAEAILERYAGFLQRNPGAHVQIGGHTDNVGDAGFNQTLSVNRANAVRDFLLARNIPAAQLTTAGHGETQPTATNDTDEGRALNRRVDLVSDFWEPLTDQFASLSISALARDRADPQTIYAGTGRVSSFRTEGEGIGILKSTDGGDTWTQIGRAFFNGTTITGIYANGDNLVVTSQRGVFHSADGGAFFTRITDQPRPTADGVDNDGDTNIDETRVSSVAIQAGGSGYAVDDFVNVEGGTFILGATLRVSAVDGSGAVTGLELVDKGEYTTQPANPAATSTGGAGSGLTLNLTFEQV